MGEGGSEGGEVEVTKVGGVGGGVERERKKYRESEVKVEA